LLCITWISLNWLPIGQLPFLFDVAWKLRHPVTCYRGSSSAQYIKLLAIANLILQYVMAFAYFYHRAFHHSLCFGCHQKIVQRPVDKYHAVNRSATEETLDETGKPAEKTSILSQQIINL
jgi:hypothetical protein